MSLPRPRLHALGLPIAAMLLLAPSGGQAQESAASATAALVLVPRLSISETFTDNVRLSAGATQSEQITQISPSIHLNVQGARIKGYFDYALTGIAYGQNSTSTQTQNALATALTLEALDNWAFLDFSGSIAQQTISALGPQSLDNSSINPNRTEVSTYRLSPYVRGRWHDLFSYEARYSRAESRSEAAAGPDVTTVDGSVQFAGDSAVRGLGWSVDANQQRVDYSAGRRVEADRLDLGLAYAITPQLTVRLRGGYEANNYLSLDKQDHGTSGLEVRWVASPATELTVSRGQRFFGAAHSLSFAHRTPRTVWKFSDTRDIVTTPSQTGLAGLGSTYELLFAQFAALEADPVARAQLVNAYLLAYGLNPDARAVNSFLTSAVSLQRRQDLSFALLGVRDTVTFIATRSKSSRLDTLSPAADDLSNASLLRQRGVSVSYAHRLTPDYSLVVLLSQQDTTGTSALADTRLRTFDVNVSGKVSPRATAALGLRRIVFSGGSTPYTENALIVTLTVQF